MRESLRVMSVGYGAVGVEWRESAASNGWNARVVSGRESACGSTRVTRVQVYAYIYYTHATESGIKRDSRAFNSMSGLSARPRRKARWLKRGGGRP